MASNNSKQITTHTLLVAYHDRGDVRARSRVIEENLPLVHTLARRFARADAPLDDLIQVGTIGLIKAVDGFRPSRGRDLGAYAVPTIVGELRRHVGKAAGSPNGSSGRLSPTAGSVRQPLPLDESAVSTFAESSLERTEQRALLRGGFRQLSRRERRIVALRYYGDLSQHRIASEVGLSQVQVSRVLRTSLAKMRSAMEP